MNEKLATATILGIDAGVLQGANVDSLFKQFMRLEKTVNLLQELQADFREKLFEMSVVTGIADGKGSSLVKLADGSWFKKEARTTLSVNLERARELGRAIGEELVSLKPEIRKGGEQEAALILAQDAPHLVEFTEAVDEAKLQDIYMAGAITDAQFTALVDRKVNYALKKGVG